VLVFTHPPSSQTASADPASYYKSDFDLYLDVNGTEVASSTYSSRNPFEIIDFTPTIAGSHTGTGRLRIRKFAWNSNVTNLRIGIGFAAKSDLGSGPDATFAVDDSYEENDTLATAYDFTAKATWLDTLNGLGIQADEDWYEIDVSPAGSMRVVVDCRFTHADGDIDIDLVDANDVVLASSTSASDNELIDDAVPGPGTYYIRVYFRDNGNTYNLWWDDLEPANSAPTDISLSSSSVPENRPADTTVGTLSTVDPDAGDTHTLSLVAGAGSTDNGLFSIVGTSLRTAASFNFEAASSYSIRVRSTDGGGLSFESTFTIQVSDVVEQAFAPTQFTRSSTAGMTIGWVTEAGFTYQVQFSETLAPGDWHDVGPAFVADNGETFLLFTDPEDVGEVRRFYMVVRTSR